MQNIFGEGVESFCFAQNSKENNIVQIQNVWGNLRIDMYGGI